ncbi:hypothetical protein [Paraburkholderia graminis]|nr:hypothetical protein [Paraburkholderia graminis]
MIASIDERMIAIMRASFRPDCLSAALASLCAEKGSRRARKYERARLATSNAAAIQMNSTGSNQLNRPCDTAVRDVGA